MNLKNIFKVFGTTTRLGYFIRRCFSFGFDWYISAVLSNLLSYYIDQWTNHSLNQLGVLAFSVLFVSLIYYVVIPLVLWKGQTLMQRAMQLKVVQIDGSDINIFVNSKRFFIGCFLVEGALYSSSTIVRNAILITYFPTVLKQADIVVGSTFMILAVVSMLMALQDKKESKLIHDRIGKTKVIDLVEFS